MSKPTENNWSQITQHFKSAKELLLDYSTELAQQDSDWNRARILFELARDVDELSLRFGSLSEGGTIQEKPESSVRSSAIAAASESPEEYGSRIIEQNTGIYVEPKRRPRKKKRSSNYFVQGNSLVKQGLKRNGRDIYVHRMSKEEFTQFIEVLSILAKKQETFKPEDAVESLAMSSYKVYLALGAMTHIGELEIPQRGTYRFCDRSRYLEQESEFWNELESQRGDVSNEL